MLQLHTARNEEGVQGWCRQPPVDGEPPVARQPTWCRATTRRQGRQSIGTRMHAYPQLTSRFTSAHQTRASGHGWAAILCSAERASAIKLES